MGEGVLDGLPVIAAAVTSVASCQHPAVLMHPYGGLSPFQSPLHAVNNPLHCQGFPQGPLP